MPTIEPSVWRPNGPAHLRRSEERAAGVRCSRCYAAPLPASSCSTLAFSSLICFVLCSRSRLSAFAVKRNAIGRKEKNAGNAVSQVWEVWNVISTMALSATEKAKPIHVAIVSPFVKAKVKPAAEQHNGPAHPRRCPSKPCDKAPVTAGSGVGCSGCYTAGMPGAGHWYFARAWPADRTPRLGGPPPCISPCG